MNTYKNFIPRFDVEDSTNRERLEDALLKLDKILVLYPAKREVTVMLVADSPHGDSRRVTIHPAGKDGVIDSYALVKDKMPGVNRLNGDRERVVIELADGQYNFTVYFGDR